MAIVAVLLPLAYRLRPSAFYQHGVPQVGSLAIALVASLWLVQRAFNIGKIF